MPPVSAPCRAADVLEAEAPDVALCWVDLDAVAARAAHRADESDAVLSADERRRAGDYVRAVDRDRFVAARASLRRRLGAELRCAPGDVALECAPGGKPYVAGSALSFSTSKRAGVALHATSWTCEVGVDVESVVEAASMERLAARCFSAAEGRSVAVLPARRRDEASLRYWTAKEAYLKGTGTGLVDGLAQLDLEAALEGVALLDGWLVHAVASPPGTVASLAWRPKRPWR
jgi:4'-phosphopantetheinyl transferase